MTRWTILLFFTAVLASTVAHGQNTGSQYFFVVLKEDGKTPILPPDTLQYKIKLLTPKANIYPEINFICKGGQCGCYSISQNSFKDYIHYNVTKGTDTMDILLKYDCSIWGWHKVNEKNVPNSRTTDTVIFTKGKFILTEKKPLNYWKQTAVQPQTVQNVEVIFPKDNGSTNWNWSFAVDSLKTMCECDKMPSISPNTPSDCDGPTRYLDGKGEGPSHYYTGKCFRINPDSSILTIEEFNDGIYLKATGYYQNGKIYFQTVFEIIYKQGNSKTPCRTMLSSYKEWDKNGKLIKEEKH